MPLLTVSNAKTVKGEKLGYATAILYLAPYTNSGRNVCPTAHIAQCHSACLYTAGRAEMFASINEARLRKTVYFFEQRHEFMNELVIDIATHVRRATKNGMIPLVRLNGTSDIMWERIKLMVDEDTAKRANVTPGIYANIFEVYPNVQFYDYTKLPMRSNIPTNYDLTFSYSGVVEYAPLVETARKRGMRIAVVFRDKKRIPAEYMGLPVVSGDDTDIRHIDPQGVIVALYAKGRAKHDTSGFVVTA